MLYTVMICWTSRWWDGVGKQIQLHFQHVKVYAQCRKLKKKKKKNHWQRINNWIKIQRVINQQDLFPSSVVLTTNIDKWRPISSCSNHPLSIFVCLFVCSYQHDILNLCWHAILPLEEKKNPRNSLSSDSLVVAMAMNLLCLKEEIKQIWSLDNDYVTLWFHSCVKLFMGKWLYFYILTTCRF